MKKIYFTIILLFLCNVRVYAHQEWVHQYIVQEAYRYLERHVGEMQVKLLQKVEERTLSMIQLKKENDLLKEKINALQK